MKVFLGSSTESREDMREVARWLEDAGHEPMPWDEPSLFLPGENTFSKIIEISKLVDAAIFIFSEDDRVWYRQDSVIQPRDNILIEYGLFAGALGQKRAIVCRKGTPKNATDLLGIVFVDLNMPHKARVSIRAWVSNLATQKEDPAIAELVMDRARLRKELEETKDQLSFEQHKARDLQDFAAKEGLIDFNDFSTDAHWKLLYDYEYFWKVVSLFANQFSSPLFWRAELIRTGNASVESYISWEHVKDLDKTRLYIAKTMRLFRNSKKLRYTEFLSNTEESLQQAVESIRSQRASALQRK
jgi:hypothetical protein